MIRSMWLKIAALTVVLAAVVGCAATPSPHASPHSGASGGPVGAAVSVLTTESRSSMPLVRANAIEMLEPAVEPLRAAVQRGLVDPNPGVRFTAAMALGRQRLCGIADLARPLLDDPSASVRAAAIFALARCGDRVDQSPLADMVLSSNREARANAAMVLGALGNPSAKDLLREAMRRPLPVENPEVVRASELGLSEALVQLGDRRQLETIRAAFFAPASQAELTALASQMAGRLGDRTLVPALAALAMAEGPRQAGPELRLIAAEALGRMDREMVLPGLAIAYAGDDLPQVRMQAAAVLAWDNSPKGQRTLERLLQDPQARVRVAAAGALLRRGAATSN
jgi:HEAT repeat protein